MSILQNGVSQMIGFVIGLFTGSALGVVVMAMMNYASYEDDRMERYL